jgi:S1-C subfamily serine protease
VRYCFDSFLTHLSLYPVNKYVAWPYIAMANNASTSNDPNDTLSSLSDSIVNIAAKVSPAVVAVHSGKMLRGTGIVWSKDGYILTCSHVIKGLRDVCISSDAIGTVTARIVGSDSYSDVALLKVETNKDLNNIMAADSEGIRVGQIVLALANPYGEQPSVTQGLVTSARSSIRGWSGRLLNDILITDARLNPGYSGGPLVDVQGAMVGMNVFVVASRGIAIRTHTLKRIVESLMSSGKVRRGYLGISFYPISLPKEVTDPLDIKQSTGLMVISVEPGSPAKKAGLLIGDTILMLGGQQVVSMHDMDRLLTAEIIGKSVKLGVLRGEKLVELDIIPIQSE